MTASLRLPRFLADAANTSPTHEVAEGRLSDSLDSLFASLPGLRNHILDERGEIRPHVSIFVDGSRASLDATVGSGAQVRVLNAVSGGLS